MPMPEEPQMVIASRLRDGLTVFLAPDNGWVEDIDDGALARSGNAAAELLRAAERAAAENVVINPYLIEIVERDGRRTPRAWREAIRAFGPTVETRATA